jgi:hypothetical protein
MSMLLITYCSNFEFPYEIKNSLEYNGICEVSRIYSGVFKEGDEMKKVVFLRIKWLGNQASVSFKASLIHNWEEKVYKLDRWEQPIVIRVDEYGNAIQYEKWIVRPSRYQEITEWKNNIEGEFTVWSHPEHEDDPDEDEVEPEYEVDDDTIADEELPLPKLKRCNAVIPGEDLRLDFPQVDEPIASNEEAPFVAPPIPKLLRQINLNEPGIAYSQAENDAEIKKLFNVQHGISVQDKARIAVISMTCNFDLEELKHLVQHTPFYHEIEKIQIQLAKLATNIARM